MTEGRSGAAREYDYIVVGSGAGGAPLAARLAEQGKRVLVIEAGPALTDRPSFDSTVETTTAPGLHAASTEHPEIAWRFFVDHYQRDANGRLADDIENDPKEYNKDLPAGDPQRGIFYPRSSALGGCTAHHAMITIAGPDSDWDDLAEFLRDDSWSGARMRTYFQRMENNGYLPLPCEQAESDTRRAWAGRWHTLLWILGRRPDPTAGRHGFHGWLYTSVADLSVGLGDSQFKKILSKALWHSVAQGLDRGWTWVSTVLRGESKRSLDPNHSATQAESPEGVVLIPAAIYGRGTTKHFNRATPFAVRGARCSPRDFLLETQARYPDRLEIWTDCLVTKVLLNEGDQPRRAIGVEYTRGRRLYRAHVNPETVAEAPQKVFVARGGEVILCGGTFNTPQLLMLSGIGDPNQLNEVGPDKQRIECLVPAPGVGKNLQDRYEVSLVGQTPKDLKVLDGATFRAPGALEGADPVLQRWRRDGTGLYGSNGPSLGIFKRSRADIAQPDLFIFGVPLEFRGYEVGYSEIKDHDRFTWVILKSHTRNSDGWVRLRSTDPRDAPLVNFNYFNTAVRPGGSASDPDLEALVRGVDFVRGIFEKTERRGLLRRPFVKEIHPGHVAAPPGNTARIKDWIRRDAWGHHACGTCRMGPDGDPEAVLDSRFRVRNVAGLRVVDASIFPTIPGYFIVTNIYMASEKAAEVILADSRLGDDPRDAALYPRELFELEADALKTRRTAAKLDADAAPEGSPERPNAVGPDPNDPRKPNEAGAWKDDVTGLALSGGGIRSATTCLGVLQTMARNRVLRRIDFLSTVSGGGYIGACLGRLFDRMRAGPKETRAPVVLGKTTDRVESELIDPDSPVVGWLRRHGNYIAPQGRGDAQLNAAVFFRNLISVHLVVGIAIFAAFGLLNAIRYGAFDRAEALLGFAIHPADLPLGAMIAAWFGPFFSPWFLLVELLLLFFVLPRMIGYWVVSQDRPQEFKPISLSLLFLFVVALLALSVWDPTHLRLEAFVFALALLSTLIHIELAWKRGEEQKAALGVGDDSTQRLRTRNYLTYDLGLALALTGTAFAFALIDTAGHALHQWTIAANKTYATAFSSLFAALAAGFTGARGLANFVKGGKPAEDSSFSRALKGQAIAGLMALGLMALPLLLYSFASHAAYQGGDGFWIGVGATLFAALLTMALALPSAVVFVNRSSLSQTYAARLARAYLGASNPLRHRPEGANVTEVAPGDDVGSIVDYRPHEAAGPLHLINVTVNQTVDRGSSLQKRDRHGENMAVSCLAVSVGERWHARWDASRGRVTHSGEPRPPALKPLGELDADHPFLDLLGRNPKRPEPLPLRQWVGISGAAIDAGRGRATSLGTALFMGLVNLRTGYWWDSGLRDEAREGYPRLTPTRRLLAVLPRLFVTQSLLIFEWIARYPGPWKRFWHLADGGFFENTAAYELIRRRVPRIILCDGGADPRYEFEDFAELVRKARIDFAARIEPFRADEVTTHVPVEVARYVGTLDDLRPPPADRPKFHAALFWIHYDGATVPPSVLLLLKPCLNGDEPADLVHYKKTHEDFPQEATADQVFDETQWESYRKLGEHLSGPLFASDWFWRIPR